MECLATYAPALAENVPLAHILLFKTNMLGANCIIYTLTPNPALDLCGIVERITPNEKNYVFAETRFPGGNAVNVARLLTKFSIPVCATGFLGGGVGHEVQKLLDLEHAAHNFVEIKDDTRISITVSSQKTHQQTRLSFSGPKIQKDEINSLMKRIYKIHRGSWLVIGGSFPPGFHPSHVNKIIRVAKNRGILIALDVPGPLLRKVNLNGVVFIKPNLIEFQELIGKKVESITSIIKAAKKLTKKVDLVFVSSVKRGALLVSKNSVWFGLPPKVQIRSTVGAGDSMVAGILAELWRQQADSEPNYEQMGPQLLQKGLAFATATLATEGTQLGNVRDVSKFYSKVSIRQIGVL
jgi:1-phosphofructokinase family hexose kinase